MYPKFSLIALALLLTTLSVRAENYGVTVFSNGYSPTPLTVEVGDTVDWTGQDGLHTVNSFDCSIDCLSSGNIFPGSGGFTHTFYYEGTFDYMCLFHPGMEGRVTVVMPIPEPSSALGALLVLPALCRRRR